MTKKWIDLFKRVETKALIGLGLLYLLHPLVDSLLWEPISKWPVATKIDWTSDVFTWLNRLLIALILLDTLLKYQGSYRPSSNSIKYYVIAWTISLMFSYGLVKSDYLIFFDGSSGGLRLNYIFFMAWLTRASLYYRWFSSPLLKLINDVFKALVEWLKRKGKVEKIRTYVKYFIAKLKTEQEKPATANEYIPFLQDSALNNSNPKDKLGYEQYAKDIVARMNVTRPETAFAIGINGTWGSGKTSFFKLMRDQMPEDKFIIVEFSAWKSADAKTLVKDFFEVLSEALKYHRGGLASPLIQYADKLVEHSNNSFVKLVKNLLDTALSNSQDLKSAYETINQAIGKLDKKLVIFIDDLDRLDKTEIFEVLRLVRNTADFKNTFFVLAYDRAYVEEALRDANIPKAERYLEKIVQMEAMLPYVEDDIIKDFIKKRIDTIFNDIFKDVLNGQPERIKIYIEKSHKLIDEVPEFKFSNLREVYKYCNSFALNALKIIYDVNVIDFMILEFIKIKFPNTYTLLRESHSKIFENSRYTTTDTSDSYERNILTRFSALDFIENSNIKDSAVAGLLNRLFNPTYGYDYKDKPILYIEKGLNSIIYAQNYQRYFKYFPLQGDISDKDFNELLAEDTNLEEFDSKLNELIKDRTKIVSLNDKLKSKIFSIIKTELEYEKLFSLYINGIIKIKHNYFQLFFDRKVKSLESLTNLEYLEEITKIIVRCFLKELDIVKLIERLSFIKFVETESGSYDISSINAINWKKMAVEMISAYSKKFPDVNQDFFFSESMRIHHKIFDILNTDDEGLDSFYNTLEDYLINIMRGDGNSSLYRFFKQKYSPDESAESIFKKLTSFELEEGIKAMLFERKDSKGLRDRIKQNANEENANEFLRFFADFLERYEQNDFQPVEMDLTKYKLEPKD